LPLSLNVNSDNNARNNGRRLNLNANDDPSNAARMVPERIIGIVILWKLIAISILFFVLMKILNLLLEKQGKEKP
jgi:hypothetical protein